jgi:hypothetical protein
MLFKIIIQFLKQKVVEIGKGILFLCGVSIGSVILISLITSLLFGLGKLLDFIPYIHQSFVIGHDFKNYSFWNDLVPFYVNLSIVFLAFLGFLGLCIYGIFKFIKWIKSNWEEAVYQVELKEKLKNIDKKIINKKVYFYK